MKELYEAAPIPYSEACEVDAYEAGILDAHEQRRIIAPYQSNRLMALMEKQPFRIGDKRSIRRLDAYNSGVAYEMMRQAILEL